MEEKTAVDIYVAKTNTSIEINGTRYDAKTGASLKAAQAKSQTKTAHRTVGKPLAAHAPKHAKTLMRHAVKKPGTTKKVAAHGELAGRSTAVIVNRSAGSLDSRRVGHAKRVPQSRLIRHFSDIGPTRPEPVLPPQPAPVIKQVPVVPPSVKPRTTSDLFEHALKNATSHKQPLHAKKRRSRKPAAAAAVFALLLLAGLTGSQVMMDMRLHVASAKVGFDAGLPGYKPVGYSLSQINYNDTTVATAFSSNSNDSNYSLTRQRSNWDSQALRDQYVAPADAAFKTVSDNGKTIYLYADRNASWVSNGIWYIVQSKGALNDRQLLDLANSL